MTVTGTTLGSVHYFSPEQARGDEVTGASDVYSLGIVLYEMLTGRRPFEADSAAGVALKRLNEDPPPPESFVPVPSGLSAIVMRALQREPADRFPDAGSFAEALRTWQKDPSAGGGHGRRGGGRRRSRRRRACRPAWASRPSTCRRRWPCRPTAPRHRPPAATARAGGRGPAVVGRGRCWLLGILLLGLIGYLGVEVFGGLGPDATPSPTPEQITLPDYEGQPIAAVRADAGPARPGAHRGAGAVRRVRPQPRHPHRSAGRQPGERGRHRSRSSSASGVDTVAVPNLIGQTRTEATATLSAAGLRLGQVDSEPVGAGGRHCHPHRSAAPAPRSRATRRSIWSCRRVRPRRRRRSPRRCRHRPRPRPPRRHPRQRRNRCDSRLAGRC